MRDYRSVLRAKGIKPIPKNLRTERRPGDVEIIYQPITQTYASYRHPPAPRATTFLDEQPMILEQMKAVIS